MNCRFQSSKPGTGEEVVGPGETLPGGALLLSVFPGIAGRSRMAASAARRLAMLAVLGMAGLDAHAANRLIDDTPELRA